MNFGECSVRKSSKIIFVKNNWLSHFRFLSSPLQWSWDSLWIQIILRWGLQGADMLCGEGTLCNSNGCIWACFVAHYATHRSGYKRINRHKQLWTSFGGMEALSGFWCQRCTVAGVSNSVLRTKASSNWAPQISVQFFWEMTFMDMGLLPSL